MFENLHFDFSNKSMLLILGAYGIVQVLAQDLGIKTGKRQRELVQSMPVQIILLFAGAYTVTENYTNALIATSLYYLFKICIQWWKNIKCMF